jgi:hypothetical protein
MKTFLQFIGLLLLNLTISGQIKKCEYTIADSNIKPWITKQTSEYQASYHFSNSELESTLLLVIDNDSCHAKIRSGKWVGDGGKVHWVSNNETIKNVKIIGNRFFSDKTNGEFVSISINEKKLNGLMVYKPWSSWIFYGNDKGYEIGCVSSPDKFNISVH